ncbi:hypothetical protein FACS189423_00730 [Bacteroidia bacterium]|nr:hypothetical protein FACS189423_00730 [Bacteroidia bacterium]
MYAISELIEANPIVKFPTFSKLSVSIYNLFEDFNVPQVVLSVKFNKSID